MHIGTGPAIAAAALCVPVQYLFRLGTIQTIRTATLAMINMSQHSASFQVQTRAVQLGTAESKTARQDRQQGKD